MSITKRLLDIARSAIGSKIEELNKNETFGNHNDFQFDFKNSTSDAPISRDPAHLLIIDDLALFGLGKEAKWEDVKSAYRGECKKYHSDLHQQNIEKKKAAEEIMVILNTSYARLKTFYNKK